MRMFCIALDRPCCQLPLSGLYLRSSPVSVNPLPKRASQGPDERCGQHGHRDRWEQDKSDEDVHEGGLHPGSGNDIT